MNKATEWKDTSSYSRGQVDRTPNNWSMRIGVFRLVVHRHIHCDKNTWLATFHGVFDGVVLSGSDADEAKAEAVKLASNALRGALRDLEGK